MSTIDLIDAAAARLAPVVRQTPLLSSPFLDKLAGRRVLVKAECVQHTGSFKFRGGWAAISALDPEVRARGVLAFSSGNHAQGVARAAQLHGVPATIVMPKDAPAIKINNTRAFGAEVVLYDRENDNREEIGLQIADERGLTVVSPYDDHQVIAGQGTCGLEIAAQAQAEGVETADVLVCCGGGGLTSGIAVALSHKAPNLRVRPCEPEGFDDVARSLETGKIQSNAAKQGSICDAVLTPAPGEITFALLQEHCGPGLIVSDDDALRAVAAAFLRLKIVVEPGGAVALAAALRHQDSLTGEAVIVVCTGGNIDSGMMTRAITTHGDTV